MLGLAVYQHVILLAFKVVVIPWEKMSAHLQSQRLCLTQWQFKWRPLEKNYTYPSCLTLMERRRAKKHPHNSLKSAKTRTVQHVGKTTTTTSHWLFRVVRGFHLMFDLSARGTHCCMFWSSDFLAAASACNPALSDTTSDHLVLVLPFHASECLG